MLYEIINPSDHYTIECNDLEIAAVACVLLGDGQYAFDPLEEGGEKVPLGIMGGLTEWFKEHFNASPQEVFRRCVTDRAPELADALDSVLIGNRKAFLALAPSRDAEGYAEARAAWHEANRSSMNNIGGRAYQLARRLREGNLTTVPRAPQQVFGL